MTGRTSIKLPHPGTLLALLVAVLCGMFFLKQCSQPNGYSDGKFPPKSGGDTLDIAIEISPLSYSLSHDTVSGLDYDILRDLSKRHRRPVKFHPFAPLDYAIEGLENGYFDIVVSSLPSTRQLKDELPLTDEIYTDREVLVQRRDNPRFVKSAEMLAADTVWIAAGSPIRERLVNLSKEIGDTIIINEVAGATSELMILRTAIGELPRAVVNEGIARRLAAEYPDLDISTPVSFSQFQSWAVSPGRPELRDTLNSWLKEYRGTAKYQRLLKTYLNR